MNISFLTLIIESITLINFIFIIAAVFFERKKPASAAVWIMVLTFLPLVGFVLYLVFGRNLRLNKNRIFRLKKEYDDLYYDRLIEQKHLLDDRMFDFTDKSMKQYSDIIEMLLNTSRSIYSQDNDITIFTDAKDKYDQLLNDIEEATSTIHLLYYIIKNDRIGKKVADALTRKAKDGIEVRVLYDQIGSLLTPPSMFKELRKAGGKVSRFFPLRFGTYLRLNFRNHRKIVVIDGKIGYIGGMNIGDEYMGLDKRKTPWRDTHLRITGTAVRFLQERFLKDWYYASREEGINESSELQKFFPLTEASGKIGIQVVSSGPDTSGEQNKRGLIKMINSARETLFIQSPYFVPDDSFLESLQIAAMSGVDVRVMLPSVPDKKFVYRVTTSHIRDLMDYGIKVYLHPGFLHAKMAIMDGRISALGTTNIDIRSFLLDFEINTFVYDTDFSQKCMEIFNQDMALSQQVTEEWYNARGLWVKIQERIFRLFSPIL